MQTYAWPVLLREAFRDAHLVHLTETGTDQIAMHEQCWAFEEPLPFVIACLTQQLGTKAFYDVGANTGFYSALVGQLAPKATLRAFEPVDWIAQHCRENLIRHGVVCDVREVALSNSLGTASLHFPPDDHGLIETSASLNPDFNPSNMRSVVVPTARLDDIVDETRDELGLLKVDVEGHEHAVLEGAQSTIATQRPLAIIEVLPMGDIAALNRFVSQVDYVPFALRKGTLIERRTTLEFVADGWNWLITPAEKAAEVHASLAQSIPDYTSAQRPRGWRERLNSWRSR